MAAAAVLPGANGAAPAVRLRRAQLADASRLAALYGLSEADMLAWLRTGGVLLVEDGERTLAAVRWQPGPGGWRVEPVVRLPDEHGQAYGRWLMTKLEALAIRGNVGRLDIAVDDPEQVAYYQRLGYRAGEGEGQFSKRVGGVWQRQAAGS